MDNHGSFCHITRVTGELYLMLPMSHPMKDTTPNQDHLYQTSLLDKNKTMEIQSSQKEHQQPVVEGILVAIAGLTANRVATFHTHGDGRRDKNRHQQMDGVVNEDRRARLREERQRSRN